MNYNEAKTKLDNYNQGHVFKFYEELTNGQKEALINQVEATDFEIIKHSCENKHADTKGVISPISVMTVDEIAREKAAFDKKGLEAIKAGEVAAVLLAGGMGTRLGSDAPKGVYNIGITKDLYIFECLVQNLMQVVGETKTYIHLFIMTSEKNNDTTVEFFKNHNYFGYSEKYIHFESVLFRITPYVPSVNAHGKT